MRVKALPSVSDRRVTAKSFISISDLLWDGHWKSSYIYWLAIIHLKETVTREDSSTTGLVSFNIGSKLFLFLMKAEMECLAAY